MGENAAVKRDWRYYVEEVREENLTKEYLQNQLLNDPNAHFNVMDLLAIVDTHKGQHLLIFRY